MIIKLTRLTFKDNKVIGSYPILFNTDRVITIEPTDKNDDLCGCRIRHVAAMVDGFSCAESLEQIEELIKNAK